MNQKIINFDHSYLSSRNAASILRRNVEEEIGRGNRVLFDLSGVESISPSYCDELFAILAQNIGENSFARHVAFVTPKRHLIESISVAIVERLPGKSLQTA
ncbi:STAS-like domain-containing protein [Leptospira sp. GIMC2001]|uniref:STAS-like domain-containing protein n=1 Tax=Leptospira sp. GIMC2001 TaxID=1513297 RepID=UPI002349F937|nr:STAS-like domain-containing protein [Leptospira sp. GIMC2001]WCL51484.1 STAS-like domain-containing protein [Leptospira sp. GIMC2001]